MESIPTRKNRDGTLFVSQQWEQQQPQDTVLCFVFRYHDHRYHHDPDPSWQSTKTGYFRTRKLKGMRFDGGGVRMIVSYAEVINRRREEDWFFSIVSSSRYQNKRDPTATEYIWLSNTLQLLTPRKIISLHHIIIPVSKKTKEKEDDNKIIIISSSEQEAVTSKR